MKKTIIAALLVLSAMGTATAQTTPERYDRPSTNNHQSDGHQHLVYWSDFFDHMSVSIQSLADCHSTEEMVSKKDEAKKHK